MNKFDAVELTSLHSAQIIEIERLLDLYSKYVFDQGHGHKNRNVARFMTYVEECEVNSKMGEEEMVASI